VRAFSFLNLNPYESTLDSPTFLKALFTMGCTWGWVWQYCINSYLLKLMGIWMSLS
jgi:hypothetical protein